MLVPAGPPAGVSCCSADASFLAAFLACFSIRRSRSLFSRVSFDMVVFLVPLDPMHVPSCIEGGAGGRADVAREDRRGGPLDYAPVRSYRSCTLTAFGP